MPADWINFVTNVANKLDGQTIQASYDTPSTGNVDDFSTYLSQQYLNAIVGKAQSPYGNTHQKGKEEILITSFSEAFKKLESEASPTFEEKQKDPRYADLKSEPVEQKLDEEADKFDLDFLKWTEDNGSTISDLVYSSFFSQFPNYPENEELLTTEIARRIINRFDGTSDYLQWIYSLKLQQDDLSDLSSKVYDKIIQLTQGLDQEEIKVGDEVQALSFYPLLPNGTENFSSRSKSGDLVRGKISSIRTVRGITGENSTIYKVLTVTPKGTFERTVDAKTIQKKLDVLDFLNVRDLNLSRKVLQESNSADPQRIPEYVTPQFITKFTYDPEVDKNLFSRILYTAGATRNQPGSSQSSGGRTTLLELQQQVDTSLNIQNVLYSQQIGSFLGGDLGDLSVDGSFILNSDYLASNEGFVQKQKIKTLFSEITLKKINSYNSEVGRYFALRRRYVDFLIDKSRKNQDEINPNDPYEIMADGVIKYWISCLEQPLSSSPPVPPCTILPPSNGIYVGIYYGSAKDLANDLRRAFNDGKNFKAQKTGRIVANSLASSFQKHLLQLKFVYNGGIPTPGGPVPMIGFIPAVF